VTSLPPLVGRLLAVLILVVAVALVYLGAVQPLIDDYQATRDQSEDMQAAMNGFRRIAAEVPVRRAQLATLRQRQAASEGFLQGNNEALVAAQIQNRVKALTEAARGELKSTQVLPAQEEGKYRRITIRVQLTLDLPAAQRLLYGIETASPLLFLDNLDMRAHVADRRRDRGLAAGSDDAMLDLRFDVFGYVRGGKTEKQSVATSDPLAAASR
jgi:general secretion pathway protein M